METQEIISILRKAEHVYEGEGFPKEGYNPVNELVMELDEDQNRLYNAILKTIPRKQLAEIAQGLSDCAASFEDKLVWMSKDHPVAVPRHNEPIGTLLKLYLNKSSKRVTLARRCLTERFDKQSYRDQNNILRAFLQGAGGDCDWAGRRLRDNWRKELKEDVIRSWERSSRPMLAYVILRHFPNEYILTEQDRLAEAAGYQYVCARVGDEPSFVLDASRLSTPDCFYVWAKLGRQIDKGKAENDVYDYLRSYDKFYDTELLRAPNFSSIIGWDRMVWAMGVLGMQDELVRLLEFENRVKAATPDNMKGADAWPYFVVAIKKELDPDGEVDLEEEKRICDEKEYRRYVYSGEFDNIDEQKPSILCYSRMNDEEETSWKDVQFKERRDALPSLSLKDEWILFSEIFYDDRPRLQNVLNSATVSEDGDKHIIEIPVYNQFQEDWFKGGPLDEIETLYRTKCGHPEDNFLITIKHSDDYGII